MDGWTEFTLAALQEKLPSDVLEHYAAWIDADPSRVGRLEALIAETRDTFRAAVSSHPENVLDPDPTTIPVTGFRHALNTVVFNLVMETGAEVVPEAYTLLTRADIWLRTVQRGEITFGVASAGQGGTGSPSYVPPEEARAL